MVLDDLFQANKEVGSKGISICNSEKIEIRDELRARCLSYVKLRAIPYDIRRNLRSCEWTLIHDKDRHHFRYQHDARFWIKDKRDWRQVRFTQYNNHVGERYLLVPYKPIVIQKSSTYSVGDISERNFSDRVKGAGLDTAQINKLFFGCSTDEEAQLEPTVYITKPTHGASIELKRSDDVYMRFSFHKLAFSDTLASVAKRYTGLADPRIIYNHNYSEGYHPNNPPQVGDTIKVPSGWDIKVEGSACNTTSVNLQWKGSSCGSKVINVSKLPLSQSSHWETRLTLESGSYLITALASSAKHCVEVVIRSNSDNMASLTLEYFYDNDRPIQEVDFEVLDSIGNSHKGVLQSGISTLEGLPEGRCEITYFGISETEERELKQLRQDFKHHLNNMVAEAKENSIRENALFEQESFLKQWAIEVGARATGLIDGAQSLISGIADLASLSIDVHIALLDASTEIFQAIRHGDVNTLKQHIETILQHSNKQLAVLQEAYDVLVFVLEDKDTRNTLAQFPFDYIDAHSHVEKKRMLGIFAFEILFAVLTGGTGTVASTASKSKHVIKANKVLKDIKNIQKRRRLNNKQSQILELGNNKAVTKVESKELKLSPPKSPPRTVKGKYGTNEAVWQVDELGRPITVEAKLDSTYNTIRSKNEKNEQQSIGGNARKSDDDGGHVIAHRFMSDQGEKNLFPQNSNLNRSGYKKMENEWADWIEQGFEVKLKVDLHPPGSQRPTDIISKYDVYDPKTGSRIFRRVHTFNNSAGEAFDRVLKSDMESFRE